jgi:hypothetical protein
MGSQRLVLACFTEVSEKLFFLHAPKTLTNADVMNTSVSMPFVAKVDSDRRIHHLIGETNITVT